MGYDRKYLTWALAYVIVGMSLGVVMAASHDHAQHVTHAHINLVGFVVSLIYAVIHKLWLENPPPMMARIQFYLHQAGSVTMFSGLLLLYGQAVPEEQIEPVLALASITVLIGATGMFYMVLKANAVKKLVMETTS